MELLAEPRSEETKAKALRREGKIPAILYSKGEKGQEILIDTIAFTKLLNQIPRGTLSSKTLLLKVGKKSYSVIVKEIQYHPTTYNVLHIDFLELVEKRPVTLNIPLALEGASDCIGVKEGGVLRLVVRKVKVRCTPDRIPDHFTLNVEHLGLNQMMKLEKIVLPEGVEARTDLREVAVVVAKR